MWTTHFAESAVQQHQRNGSALVPGFQNVPTVAVGLGERNIVTRPMSSRREYQGSLRAASASSECVLLTDDRTAVLLSVRSSPLIDQPKFSSGHVRPFLTGYNPGSCRR
jgi:hypothetical protein